MSGAANRTIFNRANNALSLGTNNTARLHITNAGNVGIGTTSPATTLDVNGNVTITDKIIHGGDTNTAIRFPAADTVSVETAGTERMRINSAGLITTNSAFDSISSGNADGVAVQSTANSLIISRSGGPGLQIRRRTNNGAVAEFRRNTASVGAISVTTSGTVYVTTSDYRLKENVVSLTGAIDRLQQIPVHRFNFIVDPDTVVDGFIAHEAQEIVPECVTGTKDEVDEDGNPVMQGIDQSKLVPLLTAALQEAIGRIETLEAEVAALKAS
jgi:hypothetical protein